MKKENRKKRIDKWLELPTEIISNDPKITIVGFNEMLIENHKGILAYEDVYIRVNTHIGIININGLNLKLNEMTGDDILVTGKVEKIELENNFDEE